MDRWKGVFHASSGHGISCRVATSLCYSPTSSVLAAPSRNAVLFMGDRVEGTGNPVIERLANLENLAAILVSKFGSSVNAWVVEAPSFVGTFAVYREFLTSTTHTGEPYPYDLEGFPAATTTTSILANCLHQVKAKISLESQLKVSQDIQSSGITLLKTYPKTVVLGFSKGGVVVNQLLTELAHSKTHDEESTNKGIEDRKLDFQHSLGGKMVDGSDVTKEQEKMNLEDCESWHGINLLLPSTPQEFLDSIEEFHYVDVGLNCHGAYQTNPSIVEGIGRVAASKKMGLRILLHGTPRQWADCNRPWIALEKNKLLMLLQDEARKHKDNKLQVSEKLYFADGYPSMQMHFEIIEKLILS